FQAEDGIRDFHVTGVQTCALPISSVTSWRGSTALLLARPRCGLSTHHSPDLAVSMSWSSRSNRLIIAARRIPPAFTASATWQRRSEERRVGKECRRRRAQEGRRRK